MSRPLRIEYEDAWYHVMNRGINKQNIFYDDKDREIFFDLIDNIHQKFKIEIHGYCLMSNHYHLLIRTPFANLNRAMRHLNSIYALRFNQDKMRDGPVFRGRYKAIIIENESYFLNVSRYIHLNPTEAKICNKPEEYRWSSYSYYVSQNNAKPCWLYIDEILSNFNNSTHEYTKFINDGIDENTKTFYSKSKTIPIFGSKEFGKYIKNIIFANNKTISKEISERKAVMAINTPSIEEIMNITANFYGTKTESLKKTCRGKSNYPRAIAIYLAASLCQETFSKISHRFEGISYGGISNVYKRITLKLSQDSSLRSEIEILKKLLHDKT